MLEVDSETRLSNISQTGLTTVVVVPEVLQAEAAGVVESEVVPKHH